MSDLVEHLNLLLDTSREAPLQLQALQSALQQLEGSGQALEDTARRNQSENLALFGELQGRLATAAMQLDQRCISANRARVTASQAMHGLQQAGQTQVLTVLSELHQARQRVLGLTQSGHQFSLEITTLSTAYVAATSGACQSLQNHWSDLDSSLQQAEVALRSFAQVEQRVQAQHQTSMVRWNEQFAEARNGLDRGMVELRDRAEACERKFVQVMEELPLHLAEQANRLELQHTEALEEGVTRPCQEAAAKLTERAILYMGQQSVQVEDKLVPLGVELEKQVKRSQQGTPLKPMLVTTYYFLQRIGQDSILAPHLELLFSDV